MQRVQEKSFENTSTACVAWHATFKTRKAPRLRPSKTGETSGKSCLIGASVLIRRWSTCANVRHRLRTMPQASMLSTRKLSALGTSAVATTLPKWCCNDTCWLCSTDESDSYSENEVPDQVASHRPAAKKVYYNSVTAERFKRRCCRQHWFAVGFSRKCSQKTENCTATCWLSSGCSSAGYVSNFVSTLCFLG